MRAIAGRPMLAHVIARAKTIVGVDEVILATSDLVRDSPLEWVADDLGVRVVRGSEHDVLGRFVQVADLVQPDVVMRITGDCPLFAPDVAARVLADYLDIMEPDVDYVSNDTTQSGYPDGTDVEVFSVAALRAAHHNVQPHAAWVHGDREHVTTWIRRSLETRVVRCEQDWRHLKLSVDRLEDLDVVSRIFGCFDGEDFSLDATLRAAMRAGVI